MSTADSGVGAGMLGAGIVGVLIFGVLGVIFYGIVGWVMTAILCALYNFVAGRVGGIRLEVDVEVPYPGGPGYSVPASPAGYAAPGSGTPVSGTLPPPPGWGQPGT